jgi:hypothetical protein
VVVQVVVVSRVALQVAELAVALGPLVPRMVVAVAVETMA